VQRKLLILLPIVLVVVLLDQWSKYAVVRELTTRFDDRATISERLKAMYGEPPPASFDGLHYRSVQSLSQRNFFVCATPKIPERLGACFEPCLRKFALRCFTWFQSAR
jgi:hypothetical protein